MSRLACLLIALALLAAATPALAQEPTPPGPPPILGQGPPPPPPGPGSMRGPGAMRPGMIPPELEQKYLAFMKQVDPSEADDLAALKTQHPEQYMRVVMAGIQRMRMLEMLQRRDPSAYQDMVSEIRLEDGTRRLADRYRQAPESQKPALKTQLHAMLGRLFDLREANRQHQVAQLQKQLADMRAMLQKRARNRTAIIDRRLDDMLADPGTSW